MSAMEKLKKKKKKDKIKPATPKNKNAVETSRPPTVDDTGVSSSSVISVREASGKDKKDNRPASGVGYATPYSGVPGPSTGPGTPETPMGTPKNPRPQSALERPATAQSIKSTDTRGGGVEAGSKRPVTAQSRKSHEAWQDPGTPKTSGPHSRAPSAASTVTKESPDEDVQSLMDAGLFESADMNQAHAYVPYLYARDTVAKVTSDMKAMKAHHVLLVSQIELNYRKVEDETQSQFNTFVVNLRGNYQQKAGTFRQVIDLHRLELQQKQEYWDEALSSLSTKNRQLMKDKKKLLIQNKLEYDELETEKDQDLKDLRAQLDDQNKELSLVKNRHNEEMKTKEREHEEEKDKEIRELEDIHKEEIQALRAEMEGLRLSIVPAVAMTASSRPASSVSRAPPLVRAPTVVVTDLSEDERRQMERERAELDRERAELAAERAERAVDLDRHAAERAAWQQERAELQAALTAATADAEVLKAKYAAQKARLEELSDIDKKYELLKARFDAAMGVASVNTEEEHAKAKVALAAAEADTVLLEEEQRQLAADISSWEDGFVSEHGRPATPSDRSAAAQERYDSRDETDLMLDKLGAKVDTIRSLMKGEVPQPPVLMERQKTVMAEPEVKVVQVRVPDPGLQMDLDMTREELEAMRRQILALRGELSQQRADHSVVSAQLAAAAHDNTTLGDTNTQLEARLAAVLAQLDAQGKSEGDSANSGELEKKLQEKQLELDKLTRAKEAEITALEKQIERLKDKLEGRGLEPSELEQRLEELEAAVLRLDLEKADVAADRDHHKDMTEAQAARVAELLAQLAGSEGRTVELSAAASAGDTATAQLAAANSDLDDLRARVKQLEQEQLELREEMSEKEKKHELLKSDMEKDMKLMLKEIAKLRNKLKDKADPPPEPAVEEEKTDKLEDNIIDLEHQVSTLGADNTHLEHQNEDLRARVDQLEADLSSAEKKLAVATAAAAALETTQAQLAETQADLDELRQKVKELEQQLAESERVLREREREHEHALWEQDKLNKEMESDLRKLLKQMAKLKAKLKDAEALAAEVPTLRAELEARGEPIPAPVPDDQSELRAAISALEEQVAGLEEARDHEAAKADAAETRAADVGRRLETAEEKVHTLRAAAAAQVALDGAVLEIEALRRQIQALEEGLRGKQQTIDERDSQLRDHDRDMRRLETDHEAQLRARDKKVKDVENDIRKLLKHTAKLKAKLGSVEMPVADPEVDRLEDRVTELEKQILDLEGQISELQRDNAAADTQNKTLTDQVAALRQECDLKETVVPLAASTPVSPHSIEDLLEQVTLLQQQVDEREAELRDAATNQEQSWEELEAMRRQVLALQGELSAVRDEAKASVDTTEATLGAEVAALTARLAQAEESAERAQADALAGTPPDTAAVIKDLREKLKAAEKKVDSVKKDNAELEGKIKLLEAKISGLEKSAQLEKTSNSGNETKLKQLKTEKDREIKKIQSEAAKKEKERADQERKKLDALEHKIRVLEAGQGTTAGRAKSAAGRGGGADPKAVSALQDRLRDSTREKAELNTKIRQLEGDLRRGGGTGTGGGDIETARQLKKQEKVLREIEKLLDAEKKKAKKNSENLKKLEEELKDAQKTVRERDTEIAALKARLAQLDLSATEAQNLAKEIKKLKQENKKQGDEMKTISDNFNSERVLRKKYYNMVEDMKGKIRVYCRVRPISKSERDRGNTDVTKSPDEYTISVGSSRGVKEFQFDSVFTADSSQEKVFEDTNNLVQSAVDGYNVCIFAYGQTGSGKTFTIIGDRDQTMPGIAPRAFNRIFSLLDQNKSKFSYKVTCYMLELYNDRLLDLFSKASGNDAEEKLEIKKDKKGMVVVQGSEVKPARNANELYALFEEGSKTRHTASTKMNSESSRSHLVIGITIETTNKSTGNVLKGKLSLVDLAGSERAAKTEASAEQLKEAMSINKSLSALGDVISALSSEQQFIPYRNNKLTMLMQDSLGGNAKTLMFVNISPVDYNSDESVVSLTYASRVKLITNDAQKNADNKEINRLKNIILKMKKGDSVEADADD